MSTGSPLRASGPVTGKPAWFPLARACHPGPCAVVTLITVALALAAGHHRPWLVGVAVLGGQLTVGWHNDLVDLERDRASGRGEKPLVAGELSPRSVALAASVAAVACVAASMLNGPAAGTVHLAAVASALGYNAVAKRTPMSVVPYAVSFALLPAFVSLGVPGAPWPPAWAMLAGGLFGAGAHFLNALDDIDVDRRTGVLGLPQRIGPTASLATGTALLGAAILVLVVAPPGAPHTLSRVLLAASAAALVAVLWCALAGRREDAWRFAQLTALLAVAMFVGGGSSIA